MNKKMQAFYAAILGGAKKTSSGEEKTTNPYTNDGIMKRATDDRYMNLALSKRNWQIAAFIFIGIIALQDIQLGRVAMHSKVETRVALVNDGLVINTLRTDDLSPTQKTRLIDVFLRRFITDARSVSNDEALEKSQLTEVANRASDQALQYIDEYYKLNNPFKIAGKYTVSVDIVNSTKVSPNTWQIWWDETKRSVPDGAVVEVSRWYSQLSFKEVEPNPQHIKQNPFGFYITQLTWSKSQ